MNNFILAISSLSVALSIGCASERESQLAEPLSQLNVAQLKNPLTLNNNADGRNVVTRATEVPAPTESHQREVMSEPTATTASGTLPTPIQEEPLPASIIWQIPGDYVAKYRDMYGREIVSSVRVTLGDVYRGRFSGVVGQDLTVDRLLLKINGELVSGSWTRFQFSCREGDNRCSDGRLNYLFQIDYPIRDRNAFRLRLRSYSEEGRYERVRE